MRKVALLLLLITALLAGCAEREMSIWALSTPDVTAEDNEFIGRIMDGNDVKVGLQSDWIGTEGQRQFYGAVVLADIGEATPLGQPYVGAQASLGIDDDGGMWGMIAGVRTPVSKKVSIVSEAWYRDFNQALASESIAEDDEDEWKALFGLEIKF